MQEPIIDWPLALGLLITGIVLGVGLILRERETRDPKRANRS